MSGEATKPVDKSILWGGGRSPFSVSYGKMMMWFFLVSDALTFSGLLVAYGLTRHAVSEPWPIGEQAFNAFPGIDASLPLAYVAMMTFILIVSSVTMVLSVEAGHRNDHKGVLKWLGLTIIGGIFFLGSQAWEWSHFIHGGGGAFQVNQEMTVTGTDPDGEAMSLTLSEGDRVHFDHHYGNELYEVLHHTNQTATEESVYGTHDNGHGHGHGDAEEEHSPMTMGELGAPDKLIINKYVENEMHVDGPEALTLWENRVEDSFVFGANMNENEYGPQSYANFFFFITGFHGFHVFSGVLLNVIVFMMVIKGVFKRRGHYEMVEKVGLYWHFVDLVWVFVFTFFYLI